MRKLSAILLLLCLAIYQFGYFAVDYWGEQHVDKKWSEKIYESTVNDQAVSILKVPLTVPYMPDDREFKVVNRSYEKDGKFYRVLEQRYRNDTLEMKVVNDSYQVTLESVVKEWASFVDGDFEADAITKLSAKVFSKEFNFNSVRIGERPFAGILETKKAIEYNHFYSDPKLETPTEPPRFA